MRRINKRGQWQNYLLPAIMAVIVLGISFYFIFNEYFTGEDIDKEVCKESIMVRATLPEIKTAGVKIVTFKDDFPLKCKTNVVEVTADDIKKGEDGKRNVERLIGDAFAECWFLFDNGDANAFPASVFEENTICMPCARIHLSEEAKKAVIEDDELKGNIDIEVLLNDVNLFNIGDRRTSYINYLNGAGSLFYPFNPMGTGEFNLSGDKFEINGIPLKERLDYPDFKTKIDSDVKELGVFSDISLPKNMNIIEGDLIIVVGSVTTPRDVKYKHMPYMFYFQNGQDGYVNEMEKTFFQWGISGFDPEATEKICNMWEGIPA